MTRFKVCNLYTWKNENSPFKTAQVYKNGEKHSTMSLSGANEFCEKWNGRSGDFEIK